MSGDNLNPNAKGPAHDSGNPLLTKALAIVTAMLGLSFAGMVVYSAYSEHSRALPQPVEQAPAENESLRAADAGDVKAMTIVAESSPIPEHTEIASHAVTPWFDSDAFLRSADREADAGRFDEAIRIANIILTIDARNQGAIIKKQMYEFLRTQHEKAGSPTLTDSEKSSREYINVRPDLAASSPEDEQRLIIMLREISAVEAAERRESMIFGCRSEEIQLDAASAAIAVKNKGRIREADTAIRGGDEERALEIIEDVLKLDPGNPAALMRKQAWERMRRGAAKLDKGERR